MTDKAFLPHTAILCWVVLLSPASIAAHAQAPQADSKASQPQTQEIRGLIEKLGDASYPVRADAVRDLIAIGPDALPLLREAAGGDDYETALRARQVIETFRAVLFAGATVELSAEPTRLRWNQPFTLKVRIENHSSEPCQTPFAPAPEGDRPANLDALQVGAMMDLADFLSVFGPDGREIQLHTEPIDEDPEVEQALRWRAEHDPTGTLDGGSSQTFALTDFNRGWSRYRMLEAGQYTIRFEYEPDWRDPQLARRRIGRVSSQAVKVTVTEPAPAVIRSAPGTLLGEVVREGDTYVAYATNAHDRRRHLNTNWGTDPRRKARLRWFFQTEAGELFEHQPSPARLAFSLERIVALLPGQRIELARVVRREVAQALGQKGRLSAAGPHGFVYSNFLRRGALSRGEGAGAGDPGRQGGESNEQLPRFIFTGQASCVPVVESSPPPDFSNLERIDLPE